VFTLQFNLFRTVAYLLSAFIIAYIVADRKSNWIEGVELLIVYAILMFAYAFLEPF
jgi:Ca2+/H+ antiporter